MRADWRTIALRVSVAGLVVEAAWALSTFALSKPLLPFVALYADNKGALTPISLGAFHHLQLCEQRLFSAVPAAFYLVGAAYHAAIGRQRDP
jgi:hypothetical protein